MGPPLPSPPELIDLDYGGFEEDQVFYHELAKRTDGPLLELGVGTGRAAIPLAAAGHEVWGIDDDESMLAHLQVKSGGEGVRTACADMRDFDLGRKFGLIYAGMGAFHHLLSAGDQAACLARVEQHLTAGGLFACDLRPFHFADWNAPETPPLLHDWTRTLKNGAVVTKLRSVRADAALQLQQLTIFYDVVQPDASVRRLTQEVDLRFTTRTELKELLHSAGLSVEHVYGDYDLEPFDDESEYMITVARKAG